MKSIQLTHNKQALVDDEDYGFLMHWNWYYQNAGYAVKDQWQYDGTKCKKILMHRFIIDAPDGIDVDHIDGNRLNNQRHNLRFATRAQNHMNRAKQPNKSSVYKGVTWSKKDKLWIVSIVKDKQRTRIGYFRQERHAAMAYDMAAKDLFGEYAWLNFPQAIHFVAGEAFKKAIAIKK